MVKSDYIRKVSLVVGEEKYAVIREFQELVAPDNGNLVDCRIAVVGKPPKYEYEKAFEKQGVTKRVLFKNAKKVKPN